MKRFLGLCFASAALVAPAALANPVQWGVTGSGFGSADVAGDHLEVAAHSDVDGLNPRGHVENQGSLGSTTFNDGGQVVCMRVFGNRAVVVWQYRHPLVIPEQPGIVRPYGAAFIEDNGNPVDGQPVDRMADFAVQTQNVHFFCDSDLEGFFVALPLASGNFVVSGG
jgi:hypothetical protein